MLSALQLVLFWWFASVFASLASDAMNRRCRVAAPTSPVTVIRSSIKKIRSKPLPYFFAAEGKRENGTLCCGLPSGTYTNRGYVVLPLLQIGGRNATSTR